MSSHAQSLVISAAVALLACQQVSEAAALGDTVSRRPFPQHVTYAEGTILPDHRTRTQLDDDVRNYYGEWKASYLVSAGSTNDGHALYRVSFGSTDPARTVSEGQGYGMMIVVYMAGHDPDARQLFDGLWRFARAHPSGIDPRLMNWEVPEDPDAASSAFDGDCDIAFALLLAHAQWGSRGPVNYRAEALTVIEAILESTIGPDSHLPMLGDWTEADGSTYNQYTPRPSDFMPDHFHAFRDATGDSAWDEVVTATQDVVNSIQSHYSPMTGLVPDFVVPSLNNELTPKPAPPNFLEGPYDGDYYFNAGRVPWRLGVDAVVRGDSVSLEQTRRISRWVVGAAATDPRRIHAGYMLSGAPLPESDYFTILFAAPLGVAAMTDPDAQQWLNDLYDTVYATHEDYYEDSVALLCQLVMTGNSWAPPTPRRRPVHRPRD